MVSTPQQKLAEFHPQLINERKKKETIKIHASRITLNGSSAQ